MSMLWRTVLGAVGGVLMHEPLSRMHPRVVLSERIAAEEMGLYAEQSQESESFRAGGETVESLHAEAIALRGSSRPAGLGWARSWDLSWP